MAKKKKGKSGGEGRLEELELMLLCGDDFDHEDWEYEIAALAKKYPDEFGYLLDELKNADEPF